MKVLLVELLLALEVSGGKGFISEARLFATGACLSVKEGMS